MELKPCPFCGGKAHMTIAPYSGVAFVECKCCSAMMGRYRKGGRTDHDGFWTHLETEKEAAEAWNNRVESEG